MIVKNESKIIKRCIDSALPYIHAISICDTGSSDNTVELINSYSDKTNVNCLYHEWKNFGHNRQISFDECKKYCQKLGWDLTRSYALFMDADMVFAVKGKEFPKLTHGGYRIVQKDPNIFYYNVRFGRLDKNWRCVGVTHEYWTTDENVVDVINNDDVWILDISDGGSKSDKTTRDIKLLEKGIEEDPENVIRYTFYLAQSYRDNRQYEKAIELYQKRIYYGGWYEEKGYSFYQIANCYKMLDKKYEAVTWYWLSYANLPTRREPLVCLASLLRSDCKYFEAYQVAKLAMKIPLPKNEVLFIETPLYEYKAELEITIVGFYIGACEEAKRYSEDIIRANWTQPRDRQLVMNNYPFYCTPLKVKNKHNIQLQLDNLKFKSSSISFAPIDDQRFYVNIRYVTYTITPEGIYQRDENGKAYTRNVLYVREKSGSLVQPRELIEDESVYTSKHLILGLEDVRLFRWDGELWGMATTQRHTAFVHKMVIFPIDTNGEGDIKLKNIILLDYQKNEQEKNWLPLNENTKFLKVIHSHYPTKVLIFDKPEGDTIKPLKILEYTFEKNYQSLRGSAPLVKYKDNFVGMIHEVSFANTNRKYLHRFVIYNKKLKMVNLSEPFYFEKHQVEYVCGIFYSEGVFYIGYSTNDSTSNIATITSAEFDLLPTRSVE
jgi:glycosyltransferase involved in cell wall biosynthesis